MLTSLEPPAAAAVEAVRTGGRAFDQIAVVSPCAFRYGSISNPGAPSPPPLVRSGGVPFSFRWVGLIHSAPFFVPWRPLAAVDCLPQLNRPPMEYVHVISMGKGTKCARLLQGTSSELLIKNSPTTLLLGGLILEKYLLQGNFRHQSLLEHIVGPASSQVRGLYILFWKLSQVFQGLKARTRPRNTFTTSLRPFQ